MTVNQPTTVSVSRHMTVPAATVWGLISDVTRMGQWSPETTECDWRGGATGPEVGAKFRGSNVNGKFRWATTCKITDCDPGIVFAFEATSLGLRVSRWEYRFESVGDGCKISELWTDQRGWLVKAISPRVSGVKKRAEHNEATMHQTLDRLAAGAEAK